MPVSHPSVGALLIACYQTPVGRLGRVAVGRRVHCPPARPARVLLATDGMRPSVVKPHTAQLSLLIVSRSVGFLGSLECLGIRVIIDGDVAPPKTSARIERHALAVRNTRSVTLEGDRCETHSSRHCGACCCALLALFGRVGSH